MNPEVMGFIAFVLALALIVLGIPVAFTMLLVGAVGLFIVTGAQSTFAAFGWGTYSAIREYPLSVIPLFIFMGYFAEYGGLTEALYDLGEKWLGHIRNGLSIATIFASTGFAAVSGSSVGAAATMGKILMPQMIKHGYDAKLAAACCAAGGTLAIMIPPSTALVIYGMLTEQSIAKLLMAGFIPGVLSAVVYCIMLYILALVKPSIAPKVPKYSWKERFSINPAIMFLIAVIIIMVGGLYTGVFTPTEAGAIASFVTMVIALTRKQLNLSKLKKALLGTGEITSMIFLILVGVLFFSRFLNFSTLPMKLANSIVELPVNRFVILMAFYVFVYFLGCFMEGLAIMMVTLPVFFPVIVALGFNPIWFGIIMIKLIEIALLTPPVGLNVFVIKGVSPPELTLSDIYRGISWFVVADTFTLALLTVFPIITLALPNAMAS